MRVAAASLAALLVVAAAGWAYYRLDTRLHSTQAALARTRATLVNRTDDLEATVATLGQRTKQRDDLQTSLAQAQSDLAALNQKLDATGLKAYAEAEYANTLSRCLVGVQQALNAISVGDNAKAVSSLDAVSGSCQQAQQNNGVAAAASGGPSYPFDFPDPAVLRVGSTYYAYATNSALGNVQVIDSTDLTTWQSLGDALTNLPSWASTGFTWAPGVLAIGSRYVMFYTAAVHLTGQDCISVATATKPEGPYQDTSANPLICQSADDGSIDPAPFLDGNGQPYLVWKSNGNGGDGIPPKIWSAPLAADGLSLAGSPVEILAPDQGWESGEVEGPAMLFDQGTYYLFFSGNASDSAAYAIGLATCGSPAGPCADVGTDPVLASTGPPEEGPGGPAPFSDPSGNFYLAFHGWLPGKVGYPNSRELFIRKMTLAGGSVTFANL